jgi:DNA-directed RNA polymerase subunit RPC12/RpoP
MKIEYICKECGNTIDTGELTAEEFFEHGEGIIKVEITPCPQCIDKATRR